MPVSPRHREPEDSVVLTRFLHDIGKTPLLTRDEEYGAANKALFAEWMDIWVPRCLEAARALQPIWSTPADKAVTFASSFDAAIAKFTALLQEIELDVPEELSK